MRAGADPLPRRLDRDQKQYVVTLTKKIYVDFPVLGNSALAAAESARIASLHMRLEDVLREGLVGWETDWAFDSFGSVAVEGDDGAALAVIP